MSRSVLPVPTPRRDPAASLTVTELSALTRRIAAEVRAGRHDVQLDPHRRWYRQLQLDDVLGIWLISWATEQYAELHDHAGSLGAMTVVSGELVERRWLPAAGALKERRLRHGQTVAFPLGYVHDVANPSIEPAVSVHAYSPPLEAMSYYVLEPVAVEGAGRPRARLRRTPAVVTGPFDGAAAG